MSATLPPELEEWVIHELPSGDWHLRHNVAWCLADVLPVDPSDTTLADLLAAVTEHLEADHGEPEDWRTRGETLLHGDFDNDVDQFGWRLAVDGTTYAVWWTDYVANEWEEEYPDQPTALARLALLLACPSGDPDVHRYFRHPNAESWTVAWGTCVKYQLTETVAYGAVPVHAPGPA